jgi:hypothetical protein
MDIAIQLKLIFFLTLMISITCKDINNSTISSRFSASTLKTDEHKELNYTLLIVLDDNSTKTMLHDSFNTTNGVKTKEISIFEIFKSKIINYFKGIDRYTLILICAFLIGLFLIICLVGLAICICKSVNKLNKDKLTEITNPAYDQNATIGSSSSSNKYLNVKFTKVNNFDSDNEEKFIDDGEVSLDIKEENLKKMATLCTGEIDFDIESSPPGIIVKKTEGKASSNETLTNKNKNELNSSSSSSSSSSLSFGNVSIDKSPLSVQFKRPKDKSLSEVDNFNKPTNSLNHSEQDSTDHTPLFNKNTKRISLFNRTNSESHDKNSQSSNFSQIKKLKDSRKSITSSNASIQQNQQPLNFKLIQNDIDDMALNKNLIKTTSTSSNIASHLNKSSSGHLNKQSVVDSIDDLSNENKKNKSISDIYIDYIKAKRQEQSASKQKTKQVNNLLSDSNKRHSINAVSVSLNPNGGESNRGPATNTTNNASNLISNDSMSVETLGSEKSCY